MDIAAIQSYLQPQARHLQLDLREEVSSTNTVLKEEAAAGAAEGKVLFARRQTAGKGRRGRGFYSPQETGIYMSLLLRPSLKPKDCLLITTAAAVAVAEAIEKVTMQRAEIKWVNDVYCHGKKVVGILTEGGMAPEGDRLSYAVLGIGINVWQPEGGFPSELASVAGSVMQEEKNGRQIRDRLAAAVLNEFMLIYPQLAEKKFMDLYRQRSFLIGKTVKLLRSDHEELSGYPPVKVIGIGDDAQLLIELPSGEKQEVYCGQVSARII
ncbi:MAG: biotin--[acetyl-CoA-carboxylase] ligase [Lachnospiraceae bacterium]|jgi:BirA family biotin operon repressor/biotin-[acetyl-CoA-carboxylase] ligase|nr:biotin--[acetyl-CoA-carboxylase] ligase [Lachnospiraceae bacterium]